MQSMRTDVVILGGGLAGLTLARHLLLATGKRVVVVERRAELPDRPKVGESTLQLAGYYLSKVLDLEELLLRDHYLKYNLRFLWPTGDATDLEQFSQTYLRPFSNIAAFQLDRVRFEGELLALLQPHPRFTLLRPVEELSVELAEDGGDHRVEGHVGDAGAVKVTTPWVVDATGRRRLLARQLGLERESPIRHAASYAWVEGLIDVERLTTADRRQVRLSPRRRHLGHSPQWLATNHFCAEGRWLWVIPLHGRTSLGLVFDREVLDFSTVSSADGLVEWVLRELPLFAHDLPGRRILAHSGFRDFAYDVRRALDPAGWALTGEAARFSDPLYSPGLDLIALHNTLIVDAIETGDREHRTARCRRHDALLDAMYRAYIPSFVDGYGALADPESFALKYAWELAIYFSFYVFPFVNDLFTDRRFVISHLRRFARLGRVNASLQRWLAAYARWKREHLPQTLSPVDFDLYRFAPLVAAEQCFYAVGLGADEALEVLDRQLAGLVELARFAAAWVASRVLDDPTAVEDRRFVEALDLQALELDPVALARLRSAHRGSSAYPWHLDPGVLGPYRHAPSAPEVVR